MLSLQALKNELQESPSSQKMRLGGFRVVKCKPFGTILLALAYACLQVTASFDSVYRSLCKCVFAELYEQPCKLMLDCIDADIDIRNACAWLSRDIWSHLYR